ncbi:Bro-N domain-containing protein [Acinetobacter ursingii]|uniref:BRO-N domain-containing protein n=1 Tax=Acinetobacter ursingii TaxID=108980 RepID=UPI00300809AD
MGSLALSFNDVNFSPIERDGQIWLTASELAKALGYAKSDAITQIYERNKDEFNSNMTLTLNLSVKGFGNGNSVKEVRVFNTRGCHAIGFFAKTAIAKLFRKWVLDVLDKEVGAPVAKTHKSERTALHEAHALLVTKTKHLNVNEAWKLIHQRFGVDHIEEIPYDAIPVAVEYVHHLIALYSNVDKQTRNEYWKNSDVQALMYYAPKFGKFVRDDLYPALSLLRSEFAAQVVGMAQEMATSANALNRFAWGSGLTHYDKLGGQPLHTMEWYLAK